MSAMKLLVFGTTTALVAVSSVCEAEALKLQGDKYNFREVMDGAHLHGLAQRLRLEAQHASAGKPSPLLKNNPELNYSASDLLLFGESSLALDAKLEGFSFAKMKRKNEAREQRRKAAEQRRKAARDAGFQRIQTGVKDHKKKLIGVVALLVLGAIVAAVVVAVTVSSASNSNTSGEASTSASSGSQGAGGVENYGTAQDNMEQHMEEGMVSRS